MLTITLLDGKLSFIIVHIYGGFGIISWEILCKCIRFLCVHMRSLAF